MLAAQTAMARASAASSGVGRLGHAQDHLDHPLDLGLVGRAVAGDGRLDLARRGLDDRHAVLGRGQEHDPAGLADTERGLHVAREEQPLHGQHGRLVEGQQLVDQGVDGQQPVGQARVGRGHQAAMVHLADPSLVRFDDPVAKRCGPRVDPEDDHPATSA